MGLIQFAKNVGLPGIIAHGLCTMAMTSQAVIERTCDGDPTRLRRLAVRFASNVFPGNDVEVQVYDAGALEHRPHTAERGRGTPLQRARLGRPFRFRGIEASGQHNFVVFADRDLQHGQVARLRRVTVAVRSW